MSKTEAMRSIISARTAGGITTFHTRSVLTADGQKKKSALNCSKFRVILYVGI